MGTGNTKLPKTLPKTCLKSFQESFENLKYNYNVEHKKRITESHFTSVKIFKIEFVFFETIAKEVSSIEKVYFLQLAYNMSNFSIIVLIISM